MSRMPKIAAKPMLRSIHLGGVVREAALRAFMLPSVTPQATRILRSFLSSPAGLQGLMLRQPPVNVPIIWLLFAFLTQDRDKQREALRFCRSDTLHGLMAKLSPREVSQGGVFWGRFSGRRVVPLDCILYVVMCGQARFLLLRTGTREEQQGDVEALQFVTARARLAAWPKLPRHGDGANNREEENNKQKQQLQTVVQGTVVQHERLVDLESTYERIFETLSFACGDRRTVNPRAVNLMLQRSRSFGTQVLHSILTLPDVRIT
ncbi:MAG: hypothetical protein MHM6MM_006927, partial [Cercozoa sp. M6MM]